MKIFVVALLMAASCMAADQQAQWQREEKTDALTGKSYAQFTLTGKFLTPPRNPASLPPTFVLSCRTDDHHRSGTGWKNGKVLKAYIVMGAVVDYHASGIPVQYRLDDSKVHSLNWGVSTDGTAIFPDKIGLNDLFYGHWLDHKEGSGDFVHKVIISVSEYIGSSVVAQFDMPDPSEVADACGLILHKH